MKKVFFGKILTVGVCLELYVWNCYVPVALPDGYAMLMSPNKGETAVHGCHCPGDMAVRMREVLARPWVGVFVPLALSLSVAL